MLWTRAQYMKPAEAAMSTKEEAAYQSVSRAASDQGRGVSGAFFEDIPDPPNGVNQLAGERLVHLGAEAADVDVDDVTVTRTAHVPDLLGDQRPRQHLAAAPGQERQ